MTIQGIGALVLIVDDLDKCTTFYRDVIGLKPVFSDEVSIIFQMQGTDFLLLERTAATAQISAEAVGLQPGAQRMFLCAEAKEVDAEYQALMAKGLTFIKPPIDQPWGRRTTYFADPEGNLWELFQILESQPTT